MDTDLYISTKYIFNNLKNYIDNNKIIINIMSQLTIQGLIVKLDN